MPSSVFMMSQSKNVMIFIFIIFLGAVHAPVHYLKMSHDRQGTVFERKAVDINDIISIRYIHSVMKTPVYEHYRIMPDGRLVLTETEFVSYGAGLPEKNNYDFEITDRGFRVYNINRPFDFIVYRTAPAETGSDITLLTPDWEMPFLAFSEERTPVRVEIKTAPAWIYLSREVGKWLKIRSR